MSKYPKLLIPEAPLQLLPHLATRIGLNEAIVLQQIHYWLLEDCTKPNTQEGKRWVYNTFENWQRDNFPFWSVVTIKRIVASLLEQGLIATGKFSKRKYDRTNYYTINYDVVSDVCNQLQATKSSKVSTCTEPSYQIDTFSTETTTETTFSEVPSPEKQGQEPLKKSEENFSEKKKISSEKIKPENPKKEEAVETPQEAIARIKNRAPQTKTNTINGLTLLWKKRSAELNGAFSGTLTGKDVGQLKLLVKDYPDRAYAIVERVLGDWAKFAQDAMFDAGVQTYPHTPNIGFMAANRQTAANLHTQLGDWDAENGAHSDAKAKSVLAHHQMSKTPPTLKGLSIKEQIALVKKAQGVKESTNG